MATEATESKEERARDGRPAEDRADLPAARGVRGAGERERPGDLRARPNADPEKWWASWADKLEWIEPYDEVLDWSDPPFAKWFAGGKLNASANCLDRHVDAGNGDRVAFHWEGEDGDRREVTYAELLEETQRFANVLKGLGVGKGDVVGIYLPMIPETPAAMLACARIGAIHNVVFGGFSADVGQGADGVLRRQGAGHRRRDHAPRQADPDEGGGRRGRWATCRRSSTSSSSTAATPTRR